MTANTHEPSTLDRAMDRWDDAAEALAQRRLRDAAEFMRLARILVETEIQFQDAKRGAA